MDSTQRMPRVIIIGAGVAGLQCAHSLHHDHQVAVPDILILEARNKVGGRVCQSEELIPGHKIELGAETIHGSQTRLNRYVAEQGWKVDEVFTWAQGDGGPSPQPAPDGGVGAYYLGNEKRLLPWDSTDPDFVRLHEALWAMSDIDATQSDHDKRSMGQYLRDCGISPRVLGLAEAGYGNTLGASLARLSFEAQCANERHWTHFEGDGDFRLRDTYATLLKHLLTPSEHHQTKTEASPEKPAPSSAFRVRTSAVVRAVSWGQDNGLVRVVATRGTDATGLEQSGSDKPGDQRDDTHLLSPECLEAQCVIITVPLPVLRDGDISFHPPLPEAKARAAQQLGFGNAAKLHLHFSKRVVPAKLHGIICADCEIPEFWFRDIGHRDGSSGNASGEPEYAFLVTAFFNHEEFTGWASQVVESHGLDRLASLAVAQLQAIFPEFDASNSFVKASFHNWQKEPHIRCGYSHGAVLPSPSTPAGSPAIKPATPATTAAELHAALAAPLNGGQVLFAGEAYVNAGANMTVHAALDSGHRAAREAAEYLSSSSRPTKPARPLTNRAGAADVHRSRSRL